MLRIKTDNLLDRIILNLMILEIMVFRWLDMMGVTSSIIFFLVCFSFAKYCRERGSFLGFFTSGIIVIYNLLEYYLYGGSSSVLILNMFKITKAFSVMAYIVLLILFNREFLTKFIREHFVVFNVFITLNIIITLLQIYLGDFLVGMRPHTYKDNLPDYISGLFGVYGTPCMGVYLCFIFVLNYCFLINGMIKKTGRFILYNTIVLMYYFVLFLINDNKGAYFMFVISVFLVVVASSNRGRVFRNEFSKFLFNLGYVIRSAIWVLVITFFLNLFDGIHETFTNVINMLSSTLMVTTYKSYGGAQRISIILQAVRGPKRLLGYGLGNIIIKNKKAFGYDNFGLADLGMFLIEGGIIYIVLWIILMAILFQKIFKNYFITLSVVFCILVYAFYTQIFVDTSSFCSLMFTIIALEMICHCDKVGENKIEVERQVIGEQCAVK